MTDTDRLKQASLYDFYIWCGKIGHYPGLLLAENYVMYLKLLEAKADES